MFQLMFSLFTTKTSGIFLSIVFFTLRLRSVQTKGLHGPAGGHVHREGNPEEGRRRSHQADLRKPVEHGVFPAPISAEVIY